MSQTPIDTPIPSLSLSTPSSTHPEEKIEVEEKVLPVKRSNDESEASSNEIVKPKLRLLNNKEKIKVEKNIGTQVHVSNEIYINVVSEMMYPKQILEGFGYGEKNIPLERLNILGYITNPLRKRMPMEKWSPYEISIFEGCITLFGKNFPLIQKYVQTKTVKEVIEFYYDWKKTSHYKDWKKSYVVDERDFN